MSIPPIGSDPSSLIQALQAALGASAATGAPSGIDSDGDRDGSTSGGVGSADSADFSQQALAMLQSQQSAAAPGASGARDGGWKITDAQAAQVGAKIQQADATLFQQLDQNGDGKLTADEFKTGIQNLVQQGQQAAQTPNPGSSSTQPSTPAAQLELIRQALQSILGGGQAKGHHHHHANLGAGATAGLGQALPTSLKNAASPNSVAAVPDSDGDFDGSGGGAQGGSSNVSQQSLASLLAALNQSGK